MAMSLNIGGQLLQLKRPLIMGILNLTKDSFYDGGRYIELDKALAQFQKMMESGADIIDIGAFSSRPGAQSVSVEDQLELLEPFLREVSKQFDHVPISIDCFQSGVVSTLAEIKPFIVNDITGFSQDEDLLKVVAELGLPYVLMHMRGTPETMQTLTTYDDLCFDILRDLSQKVHELRKNGISEFIIDPGFGFAKTTAQNFELLANLEVFGLFERPIMVGLSRKSMIYKTLGLKPDQALNGTTALHMTALMNGAQILRVHDVSEAVETRNLWQQLTPTC